MGPQWTSRWGKSPVLWAEEPAVRTITMNLKGLKILNTSGPHKGAKCPRDYSRFIKNTDLSNVFLLIVILSFTGDCA